MSETTPSPTVGVIISHAEVAAALVGAVRTISGVSDALQAVSNEGCDPKALAQRIEEAIGERPAVLFVDLPGGSCLSSAIRLSRGRGERAVVTGVNLAMLLDFVFHRDVPPAAAAQRAVEVGSRAIRSPAA
jgi:mannose/fructose-specific phosphotransferase system component IIA